MWLWKIIAVTFAMHSRMMSVFGANFLRYLYDKYWNGRCEFPIIDLKKVINKIERLPRIELTTASCCKSNTRLGSPIVGPKPLPLSGHLSQPYRAFGSFCPDTRQAFWLWEPNFCPDRGQAFVHIIRGPSAETETLGSGDPWSRPIEYIWLRLWPSCQYCHIWWRRVEMLQTHRMEGWVRAVTLEWLITRSIERWSATRSDVMIVTYRY